MISDIQKKKPEHSFKFKVRNQTFDWPSQTITGREVLTAAGLVPPRKLQARFKKSRERLSRD